MQTDETQVAATDTTAQETTTETVVDEAAAVAASADPIDAIEDINELRKIAKGHRSAAARYKKDLKQPKPPITNAAEHQPAQVTPRDVLRAEEFKLFREGYDENEIDLIVKNGGRKILEDKNNPITLGLMARRQQRKTEEAAAQTSGASVSEVERKYTTEQLKSMSSAELAKILPHA